MTPLFSPLIERAIELAAEWHDQTYRKSRWREHPFEPPPQTVLRIPVMAHLTAVALTVQRAGWDDETVAAAFLHDALEDENQFEDAMTARSLAILVGEDVVERVRGVTEPKRGPDDDYLPWRVRKETYVDTLHGASAEAAAISLADKLHNVWTMNQALAEGIDIFSDAPPRRGLSAGPAEQLWFFHAVLDASETHDDPRLEPMRERLREEVERFKQLATGDGEQAVLS